MHGPRILWAETPSGKPIWTTLRILAHRIKRYMRRQRHTRKEAA